MGSAARPRLALRRLRRSAARGRSAASEASAVGADITAAAIGAVEGAVEIAKDTSVSAEEAAVAATNGALEAAGEIGDAAATRVRNAVHGTVRGVKVVPKTPSSSAHVNVVAKVSERPLGGRWAPISVQSEDELCRPRRTQHLRLFGPQKVQRKPREGVWDELRTPIWIALRPVRLFPSSADDEKDGLSHIGAIGKRGGCIR